MKDEKFTFSLVDNDILNIIIEHYRKKYENDDNIVKLEVSELNCAFGIRNGNMFVLASTAACDSYYHHPWDKYRFLVIFFEDNSVIKFNCNRIEDEIFEVSEKSVENTPQYKDILTDAVNFYRCKKERLVFENKVKETDSDFSLMNCKFPAYKSMLGMLKPSFDYLIERINPNSSISESLKKLIEHCELTVPLYGIENIVFNTPVSLEEIEIWEKSHQINLSETYKEFLQFADGFSTQNGSTDICGLSTLADICVEDNYTYMGSIIGDGTEICFNNGNGIIYFFDHGEINKVGDMNDLISEIICLDF